MLAALLASSLVTVTPLWQSTLSGDHFEGNLQGFERSMHIQFQSQVDHSCEKVYKLLADPDRGPALLPNTYKVEVKERHSDRFVYLRHINGLPLMSRPKILAEVLLDPGGKDQRMSVSHKRLQGDVEEFSARFEMNTTSMPNKCLLKVELVIQPPIMPPESILKGRATSTIETLLEGIRSAIH